MQVAVPGVSEADDMQGLLCDNPFDGHQQFAQTADRHDHVLIDLERCHGLGSGGQGLACRPQIGDGSGVSCFQNLQIPLASQCRADRPHLLGNSDRLAIHFDHQQGIAARGQVAGRAHGAHGSQGMGIHEFERAGGIALCHDPLYCRTGTRRVAVGGAQGGIGGRQGQQAQGGLGDEGEGAFAAHQQAGQVIADHTLAGTDPATQRFASAGDGAQTQYIIAGDSIFYGVGTTGIHRQIAADAAVGAAAGIRGVE